MRKEEGLRSNLFIEEGAVLFGQGQDIRTLKCIFVLLDQVLCIGIHIDRREHLLPKGCWEYLILAQQRWDVCESCYQVCISLLCVSCHELEVREGRGSCSTQEFLLGFVF